MPCFYPLIVYRSKKGRDPNTGKWPIVFDETLAEPGSVMAIPCGQCHGCRLERSRQWAMRCVHESKLYKQNCFITLTYNNDSLVERCGVYDEQYLCINQYSLNKRDFQLFMKKLRKKYPQKIRYLHCGEYGEKYGRPHHHAILFNHDFNDKLLSEVKFGQKLYKSKELDEIWKHGNCIIGEMNFKTAAYVSRYVMKKVNGKAAEEYYDGIQQEYSSMSRRPGIGREWYEKYYRNWYDNDKINVNGLDLKPPKYYDKIFDIENRDELEVIKTNRRKEAEKRAVSLTRLSKMGQFKSEQIKNFNREVDV